MIRPCGVCGQPLPAGKVRHKPCADFHRATIACRRIELESGWTVGRAIHCDACQQDWDCMTPDHKPGDPIHCFAHTCPDCTDAGIANTKRPLVRDGRCATHARGRK